MNIPSLAFRVGIFRNVELRMGPVFIQEFNRTRYERNIIIFSSITETGEFMEADR